MWYHSPAKINVFFRVLHRRTDGFHEIASAYQAVDWYDRLDVVLADGDRLTCDHATLPVDERNSVRQALHLFRAKTGCAFSVHCHLIKQIPVEAGLGGGSGNAATMLYACNELMGRPVGCDTLARWAGELGSDVPFFFSCGSAYCTGRGEQIEERPSKEQTVTLAVPPFGLSTRAVYAACLPSRSGERTGLYNDLERAAFTVAPGLRHIKDHLLQAGFSQVVMTGSGSAFVCYGEPLQPLDPALTLRRVKTVTRSPQGWYS